ncbi:hypothetical protein C9374_006059 [Naegleria lovaniensis]|uniref:Calcineurin-like phosphoesterase domain-containing protein n=1 Tax=Naegleria lovaniensis TaxID=51637 RepID=A0AA88GPH5_NAELO|nr:uncharacterized protein C9374_006059 [Naegleria lovaniensis]KAG2381675.1 hypothetical protein C9374_006059 [Naegleria lovaniensis]
MTFVRAVFSSDLHGNLFQYQKLVDYANQEEHRINCIIIGGDLYLKNKKHSNLDEYSHLESNKGIQKHQDYFVNHLLPILQQFKKGKIYLCFGNADLYTDVAFMKEKTKNIPNIEVLYNEVIPIMGTELELFAYSSIVFMKGHKKDFERFDTSNINDTLAQNTESYHIRMKGYTTFNETEFLEIILNGEYPECSCVEKNPPEDSHFKGVPGFHHLILIQTIQSLLKLFLLKENWKELLRNLNSLRKNVESNCGFVTCLRMTHVEIMLVVVTVDLER